MGEVVEFSPPEERCFWVCDCSCMTFYVDDFGELECAGCGQVQTGNESWVHLDDAREDPQYKREGDLDVVKDFSDDGEFARKSMAQSIADDEDVYAVCLIYESGRTRTWRRQIADTKARRGWVNRHLAAVAKALKT